MCAYKCEKCASKSTDIMLFLQLHLMMSCVSTRNKSIGHYSLHENIKAGYLVIEKITGSNQNFYQLVNRLTGEVQGFVVVVHGQVGLKNSHQYMYINLVIYGHIIICCVWVVLDHGHNVKQLMVLTLLDFYKSVHSCT